MDRWSGKVAIVTGASSGIGAETAVALANHGIIVIGLARRVEKIRQLAEKLSGRKGKIYAVECDVRDENDIIKAFRWVEKEFGGVDILVNNAGVISDEFIIDGSTETFRKILDVNVLAFAICSREAVRSMRKRDVAGHIVVVNSVVGHNAEIVQRAINLYASSKYAVTGMAASLRNELSIVGTKIKMTSVSPGLVITDMPENSGVPKSVVEAYGIKPENVADAIVYVLSTPPDVLVKELTIEPLAQRSASAATTK